MKVAVAVLGGVAVMASTAVAEPQYSDAFTTNEECGNVNFRHIPKIKKRLIKGLEEVENQEWSWFNVEGTQCMDGESTGFYLRRPLNPQAVTGEKLLVYFQGGGACFNEASCAKATASRYGIWKFGDEGAFVDPASLTLVNSDGSPVPDSSLLKNPDGSDADEAYDPLGYAQPSGDALPDGSLTNGGPKSGIFADLPVNYFRDHTMVFIPYCSGDTFIGREALGTPVNFFFRDVTSFAMTDVPVTRSYCGAYNTDLMTEVLYNTFRHKVDELVVAGSSAGGIGAMANYDTIRDRFSRKITRSALINDAGTVLDQQSLPTCLQTNWAATWKPNLGGKQWAVPQAGSLFTEIYREVTDLYSEDDFIIATTDADAVISAFVSFGQFDCALLYVDATVLAQQQALAPFPPPIDTTFQASLADTKSLYFDNTNWNSFIVSGNGGQQFHTFLLQNERFYTPWGALGLTVDADAEDGESFDASLTFAGYLAAKLN